MIKTSAHLEMAPRPTILILCLAIVAALAALLGTAAGILVLVSPVDSETIGPWSVVLALTCAVTGWSLACLLAAAAWHVARHHEVSSLQRNILSSLRRESYPHPAGPAEEQQPQSSHQETFERLLTELKELNANMLLTTVQREAKRHHQQWQIAERLAAEAEQALAKEDFDATEQLLEQLIREVPDDPRYEQLNRRLTYARGKIESEEVRADTERVEQLIAAGAHEEAEKLAAELLARHPSATQAIALLDRIRRQHEVHVTEERRRLYEEVEQHAQVRNWREALVAARRLLDAHPDCAEADAVGTRLATLENNAQLEEARELRDEIRNLLENKEYVKALNVANDLIRRFPETQAAIELGEQIEKLKELAQKSHH